MPISRLNYCKEYVWFCYGYLMIIFNAVWFSKVLKSAPHFKGAKNTSIQVTNTPNSAFHHSLVILKNSSNFKKNFLTIDLFANVVRKIKLWQFTFNRCNWFTISANYNYKVISLNDKVNDFSFINKEGWWENARDVCDPRAWGV